VRITLILFVLALVLNAGAEAQQSTVVQPTAPNGAAGSWAHCTAAEKVIVSLVSGVSAIVGMVIGWCIFPMTIAPLAYLTQSELAIWGSRLSMAIGGGITGFMVPFMLFVRLFGL